MGHASINKHEEEYSMDQDQLWRASLFKATCWVVIFLLKIRLCVKTLSIDPLTSMGANWHRCYFTVNSQAILFVKGEPLGGKGLTEPICPSLFLNPLTCQLAPSLFYSV